MESNSQRSRLATTSIQLRRCWTGGSTLEHSMASCTVWISTGAHQSQRRVRSLRQRGTVDAGEVTLRKLSSLLVLFRVFLRITRERSTKPHQIARTSRFVWLRGSFCMASRSLRIRKLRHDRKLSDVDLPSRALYS